MSCILFHHKEFLCEIKCGDKQPPPDVYNTSMEMKVLWTYGQTFSLFKDSTYLVH